MGLDYPKTSLTLLERVKGGEREARERFSRIYRSPILKLCQIIRHWSPQDAEDLTHEFLTDKLEDVLSAYSPEKGRFHPFLGWKLLQFIYNDTRKSRAAKRGGKLTRVPFDDAAAAKARTLGLQGKSPQAWFELDVGRQFLAEARRRLREEYASRGQLDYFRGFERWYRNSASSSHLGEEWNMSSDSALAIVLEARKRFFLLRDEEMHLFGIPDEE